jgi:hypothetical protein
LKSTTENLRSICGRLIVISLILFVFAELSMAYLAVFYFIPESRLIDASKKQDFLRIAVERYESLPPYSPVNSQGNPSISYSITSIRNGIEAIQGMRNGLFDVVCADAFSASYMQEQGYAKSLAFMLDEKNKIAMDRLVLVGQGSVPQFLSQTKGLRLTLTGTKGSSERVVSEAFLKYKLGPLSDWFGNLSISLSSRYALERLGGKKTDLVLVKESELKKMFPGEGINAFKVIWYSEPLPCKILMVSSKLTKEKIAFVEGFFSGMNTARHSWKMYDDSLQKLAGWKYRISGKSFKYNNEIIKEIISE